MAINYMDKIKKLLALAESSNENEAKAALLKARQLMAEHKLLEAESFDAGKNVVKRCATGIYCTKRLNSWVVTLAMVIAENYCCVTWRNRGYRKQRVEICFAGFEEDLEICVAVFRYAVDCVRSYCDGFSDFSRSAYPMRLIHRITDSYGYGFARGVYSMYQSQNRENENWGLVLTTPQEVLDELSHMKKEVFKIPNAPITAAECQAELDGRRDGEEFDPSRRIE